MKNQLLVQEEQQFGYISFQVPKQVMNELVESSLLLVLEYKELKLIVHRLFQFSKHKTHVIDFLSIHPQIQYSNLSSSNVKFA